MSIRPIRWPQDRPALLNHLRQVHFPDDPDLMAAWYGSTPEFDPQDCLVIDGGVEGEIAAHAMIVPRQFQIGENVLPVAEIALVGVLDEYRGHRYEYMLLDAIHERMTDRGDALGLSFDAPSLLESWHYEYAVGLYMTSFESSIATDLALRAGRWDSTHSYQRRMADRLGANRQTVSARRFYINDLPAIQALYRAASAEGHYLFARDEETWSWQLNHLTRTGRNDPDDFLVAEIDNRLVAYARLVTQMPVNVFLGDGAARFSVIEAVGHNADALDALLGEIGRAAQTFNQDRIGLFVHPDSAFMQHALARGATVRHFTGGGLLRLHNLEQALRLLTPTLDARRLNSRFAARTYRLEIRTEHDSTGITLGMGDPETVDIEVPATTLTRLITGWYGIDHLTIGYHERYADLLRVLFPRRDPKLGLADLI
ncbi:MAG: GNAT family N-acetyltransferase [Anaerolineae bacterium]|nr:GNAT family N-acetyltransferase [Anaerolineae bacterium]